MTKKILLLKLILLVCFTSLISRLFYLQIIRGKENRILAEENRIKIQKIAALRGVIYDRNNKILVRNTPEGREYIYEDALGQVLGYIGEISKEELENTPDLELKDFVGKSGLEKQYDRLLRGVPGGVLVETDAVNNVLREIQRKEPKSGNNLTLNLDLDLQQKAFNALKNKTGAVVITRPDSGQILALVSYPSYNPNAFIKADEQEIQDILSNEDQPMFLRAISGLYPPGSTFKIVTAIAGLQEGVIDAETKVEDEGILKVNEYSFANWYFTQYGRTEGMVDIVKAIQRSNDIYFYKVGEWLGIEKLAHWAKQFGLEQLTGIDLPGESIGLVPTPKWKKENKLERWYLGDVYITAIGQGDLQLTPLQVNQVASVIASGGMLCKPYLNSSLKPDCKKLNIDEVNLSLVKEGMKLACEEGGTGWPFFKFKIKNEKLKTDNRFILLENDEVEVPVGCKTGTAEFGDPQDKTHAWFTVFAPWEKPEIIVTVLLEKGGEGSSDAGPIAKEILSWWFEKEE